MNTFGKWLNGALTGTFLTIASPSQAQPLPDNMLYRSDDLLILDPHMNVRRSELGANFYRITCPAHPTAEMSSRTGAAIVELYSQSRETISNSLEGMLSKESSTPYRQSMPQMGMGIIGNKGDARSAFSDGEFIKLRREQMTPGGEQGSNPTDPKLIPSLRAQVALTCNSLM